jgi:hypothetical protein
MIHVSVIYDYHQAFINSKMHSTFITGLCFAVGPLLFSLVMDKFLSRITLLKYIKIFI